MSMLLNLVLTALAGGVSLAWASMRAVKAVHMLQLDSYANDRFLQWLAAQPSRRAIDLPSALCQAIFIAAIAIKPAQLLSPSLLLLGWSICVAAFVVFTLATAEKPKKPLVYTGRAIRILATSLLLSSLVVAASMWFACSRLQPDLSATLHDGVALVMLLASLAVIQLAPLIVVVANVLLSPVQRAINRKYLRQAQRRLRTVSPLVIGITGSYGKTSTKYVLERLLADHRKVLKTPLSYNTLMGVCRAINENLDGECQVLIAEMGAYRRGDVRELCAFVRPTIGILTAIGPQHLERFKTLENVQATKYELIEALPASGVAIFNNDDPRGRALADRTTRVTVMRYGLDTQRQPLDLWAEGIAMGSHGLSFTMAAKDGRRVDVQTVLLGRHNVLNILGASCAAVALGLALDDIAKAIRNLPPVPHRLQLMNSGSGVTVIDDAYNANPVGATEALEVLGSFTTGRRILVTPGMVELGPLEAQLNEELGAKAAAVCDYVILVGIERTRPLLAGLQRQNFPRDKIRIVRDLNAATDALIRIVREGDTVLFENDLADQYA
jgi:UDP-N-acetylmuramoyl-tripeptide--D-alanyl-D-alanine ligase